MEIYLVGLWITGALFIAVPWDTFPICLPQLYLESAARESACFPSSDFTQLIGVGTILCTLPLIVSNKGKLKASALIIAGLLAIGILYLYLVRPGNCHHATVPCRANTIPIIVSVGIVQALLAAAGLGKLMRIKTSASA